MMYSDRNRAHFMHNAWRDRLKRLPEGKPEEPSAEMEDIAEEIRALKESMMQSVSDLCAITSNLSLDSLTKQDKIRHALRHLEKVGITPDQVVVMQNILENSSFEEIPTEEVKWSQTTWSPTYEGHRFLEGQSTPDVSWHTGERPTKDALDVLKHNLSTIKDVVPLLDNLPQRYTEQDQKEKKEKEEWEYELMEIKKDVNEYIKESFSRCPCCREDVRWDTHVNSLDNAWESRGLSICPCLADGDYRDAPAGVREIYGQIKDRFREVGFEYPITELDVLPEEGIAIEDDELGSVTAEVVAKNDPEYPGDPGVVLKIVPNQDTYMDAWHTITSLQSDKKDW